MRLNGSKMTFTRALDFVVLALYKQRRHYTNEAKIAAIDNLLRAINEYRSVDDETVECNN